MNKSRKWQCFDQMSHMQTHTGSGSVWICKPYKPYVPCSGIMCSTVSHTDCCPYPYVYSLLPGMHPTTTHTSVCNRCELLWRWKYMQMHRLSQECTTRVLTLYIIQGLSPPGLVVEGCEGGERGWAMRTCVQWCFRLICFLASSQYLSTCGGWCEMFRSDICIRTHRSVDRCLKDQPLITCMPTKVRGVKGRRSMRCEDAESWSFYYCLQCVP